MNLELSPAVFDVDASCERTSEIRIRRGALLSADLTDLWRSVRSFASEAVEGKLSPAQLEARLELLAERLAEQAKTAQDVEAHTMRLMEEVRRG